MRRYVIASRLEDNKNLKLKIQCHVGALSFELGHFLFQYFLDVDFIEFFLDSHFGWILQGVHDLVAQQIRYNVY